MVEWHLPAEFALWVAHLAQPLHARLVGRLAPLLFGWLFAHGRRTVTSWLRAAGLGRDYKAYYYFLGSLGRKAAFVASALLSRTAAVLPASDRILLAIDDTPTKRYGPCVEGAGIHHNPTRGPAGAAFCYGHLWVTLAWVVRHPLWGAIGLPLRAALYVRRKDLVKLAPWYNIPFRTKLAQAAELLAWAADRLRRLGRALWVAVDGGYAKRPFLAAARAAGATVVSRLRKDAALCSVPAAPRPGQPKKRGPRPTYGKQAISLAKRAGQPGGWRKEKFVLYGKEQVKTYKTFQATWRPAGGLIRVVLVKERRGWVPFFCTDAQASVEQVLTAYADRAALEQVFHDVKEVHGAGEQQLRNYWANIGAFHLSLWGHTLVELWAWGREEGELVDRSGSPWDDSGRRPSHADRRNALRRACLREEIERLGLRGPNARRFQELLHGLVNLVR